MLDVMPSATQVMIPAASRMNASTIQTRIQRGSSRNVTNLHSGACYASLLSTTGTTIHPTTSATRSIIGCCVETPIPIDTA
jgi:hypothetical protein